MKHNFKQIEPHDILYFQNIIGKNYVFTDTETCTAYGHDWTEDYVFPPGVVLKPATTQEISQIAAYCYQNNIPITPIGGRTGLSGGMLPVYGGVGLALERMNQILHIDSRNLQACVQPGVITEQLQQATAALGLYYPPDPSSKGSCFIGGNVAENAGGAHAVKYGVTRDYVLALEVVLANGQVIRTGAATLKNATGYNLTQLMVGSEGTLGILTEISLKLIPKPKYALLLLVPFVDAELACDAVSAIFRAGITPSALEFMEQDAIIFGRNFLGLAQDENSPYTAQLLIELDGDYKAQMEQDAEQIANLLTEYQCGEILFADEQTKMDELWRLRRCLGQAVKGNTIYKEEDTVVPRAELAKLLAYVKTLSKEYGFYSVCYGHAGDGNLHINIIKQNLSDTHWKEVLPQAIRKLFQYVKSLGGTISGEHGIGYVQKEYMDIVFSPTEINLMQNIKQVFDPKGILNPGKIFPNSF